MGMDVKYKGKVYNPKALSKGTKFAISFNKKDDAGEWHSLFINVYTKENLVLNSKDEVEFDGFMAIDLPYNDRPSSLTIIASNVKVIGGSANNYVDNTDKPKAVNRGF